MLAEKSVVQTIVAVVLVAGTIAWFVYSRKPSYREFINESATIPWEEVHEIPIEATDSGKLKIEAKVMTPDSRINMFLFNVEAIDNFDPQDLGEEENPLMAIEAVARALDKSAAVLQDIDLPKGNYVVVLQPNGGSEDAPPVQVDYILYEFN